MLDRGMFKNILILGGGRGLGRGLALTIPQIFKSQPPSQVQLVGRKEQYLQATLEEFKRSAPVIQANIQIADLTRDEDIKDLQRKISDYDMVVYSAGGGCYGEFDSKEWKDHLWTLKLNLETPMTLCHSWLNSRASAERCFVIVGSRIAGMNPDPFAASYAAAKHGLVGFVGSLQKELETRKEKVFLFSPGYMDTEMLPQNAHVRREGRKIMAPEAAALALWRWVLGSYQSGVTPQWHRVLN